METLFLSKNGYTYALLIAQSIGGFFGVVLIFALCFFAVHIVRYAKLTWQEKHPTEAPKEEKEEEKPEEKAPAPPQEPIYYIVERKQRRAKPKYSEPKEIRFK
ncbi:MAG: hypothetical protein IJX49_05275 [Clostridia bacterium]|nr:hypothetical protein [Clostridia bacterium]